MKKCPFCAEEIQDAAIVCKHCGRDAAGATAAAVIPVAKKPGHLARNVFIGVGVLMLLGAIRSLTTDPVVQAGSDRGTGVAAKTGNRIHDALVDVSGTDRARVLGKILTSEEPCGTVTRTFYQGSAADKTAMWNVGCSNGRSYSISIDNDPAESAKIIDCATLKAVAHVSCFTTF